MLEKLMFNFTTLLSGLQAAIAVRAARDRTLTVLLVALWARIARMGTRLERLIALWRAGKLPKPRRPAAPRAPRPGRPASKKMVFPTAPAWLLRKLGYEVAAYGSQLRHMLSEQECAEFLAAVPQAGRILRPLLGMLSVDPLPEVVRKVKRVAPTLAPVAEMAGIVGAPAFQISGV